MKRTIRPWALLIISLLFVLPGQALADRYLSGKAGIFFPDESGFDEGINLELAAGWGLQDLAPRAVADNPALENVAMELGLGIYQSELDRPGVDAEFTALPLTLTGIYNAPLQETPLELYAGLGAGFYLVWAEVDAVFGPVVVHEDDLELEFGFHVLGGAAVKMNEHLALLAEIKVNTVTEDVDGAFLNVGLRYRY